MMLIGIYFENIMMNINYWLIKIVVNLELIYRTKQRKVLEEYKYIVEKEKALKKKAKIVRFKKKIEYVKNVKF